MLGLGKIFTIIINKYVNSLNILWFLLVLLPEGALAGRPLPKKAFETATGIMVFDVGNDLTFVDPKDELIDLYANCAGVRPKDVPQNIPQLPFDEYFDRRRNKRFAESHFYHVKSEYNKLAKELQINHLSQNNNVVLAKASVEKGPTFILYPEIHQDLLFIYTGNEEGKGHNLHVAQSFDVIELVEALISNSMNVISLVEGLEREYTYYENMPTDTREQRATLFNKLLKERRENISGEIGEVFRGKMNTVYIDNHQLFYEWAVLHFSNRVKNERFFFSWRNVKEMMLEENEFGENELEMMKNMFNEIKSFSAEELYYASEHACDKRSWYMANRSIQLAKQQSSEVVLVRMGADHTGGFTQILREQGYSYIILSPSYSSAGQRGLN